MIRTCIVLSDGTEIFSGEGTGDAVQSVTLTECVNASQELTLGSVCANMLEATLITPLGGPSIAAGDALTVYTVDDWDEWTKVGVFLTEKPTRPSQNKTVITAYDRIIKLDKDLSAWLEGLDGWPYRALDFARMVAAECGLTLKNTSLLNGDYQIQKFTGSGITGRRLMEWIGQISANFCRATADGEIEFAWYTKKNSVRIGPKKSARYTAPYCQGGLSFQDYQVAPIEKVQLRLTEQDVGAVYPQVAEAVNTYIITGNYLLTDQDQQTLEAVAKGIYEAVCDFRYTPCQVTVFADSNLSAGDIVNITDNNGKTITACVMTRVRKGQKETLSCTGSHRRDSASAVNRETLHSLSGKLLEVNKSVDGLQITAKQTKQELADMHIGGRNLLLKSNVEAKDNVASSNLVAQYAPASYLEEGEEYTISLCVTPAPGVDRFAAYLSWASSILAELPVTGTEKQVVSKTFTAKYAPGKTPEEDYVYGNVRIYRFPNNGTVTEGSTIHWVKVEKGNKATDWTAAPEEMATVVDMNAALEVSAEQIKSSVSKTYSTKDELADVAQRVSAAETSITQNADSIALRATKTEVTDAAKAAVDGLNVGGRNLLLKSDTEKMDNVASSHLMGEYVPTSFLEEGEEYTISICVTPAPGVDRFAAYLSYSQSLIAELPVTGTEKQVVSKTFTAKYAAGKTPAEQTYHSYVRIHRFPNDGTVTESSTIHWVKVEKGNKATDWTAAPEEMATLVDMNSAITQSASAINISVSQTYSTKADLADTEGKIKETTDALGGELSKLSRQASLAVTPEGVAIKINEALQKGTQKVATEKGYTFDDEGLTISDSESSLKTQISEDGMKVTATGDGGQTVTMLTANSSGVDAQNLHATTYLIVGKNSRFEDYEEGRTGCFWIGG